jgi:hypothetical protein
MSNRKLYYNSSDTESIEIFIPQNMNKVVVDVSGGADSSMVLHMLCDYVMQTNRFDVEITLRHVIDKIRVPYTYEYCVSKIFKEFQIQFPQIKFKPYVISFVENISAGVTKRAFLEADKLKLVKLGLADCFYSCVTSNPPEEVQKELGMWESGRQDKREYTNAIKRNLISVFDSKFNLVEETEQNIKNASFINCKPAMRVNKKFVADYYKHNEFMRTIIFPLTASCVSSDPVDTKSWTKPCMKCWWCKEKMWAFGTYDFGEIK